MAITDVITYDEVIQRLGSAADDFNITRVEPLIRSATRQLEGETGTYFVSRAYTQQIIVETLGLRDLWIRHGPIISVTSIISDQSVEIPATDYTIMGEMGRLRHQHWWPTGIWTLSLVSGWFASTAQVGDDVKQAACILIQDGLNTRGSGTVLREQVGPVSVTYADRSQTSAAGLPAEVQALIEPYCMVRLA